MERTARLGLEMDPTKLATQAGVARAHLKGIGSEAQLMGTAMAGAMSSMTQHLRQLAAGLAGLAFVRYIKQSIDLAARYETLGIVLTRVGQGAGYSQAQLDSLSKSLEKTGITALGSRQVIISMIQANLDLAQATKLARVAQDAAVTAGLNSSQTLQRILYGITSSQVEILRTVGLNVSWEQSYKKLGDQLNKNERQLTQQERTQARVNAVMEAAKQITGAYEAAMGTAGKQIQSTTRYVEDLRVRLGEVFLPQYTKAVFDYSNALKFLSEEFDNLLFSLIALSGFTLAKFLAPKIASLVLMTRGAYAAAGAIGVLNGVLKVFGGPVGAAIAAGIMLISGAFAASAKNASVAADEARKFKNASAQMTDEELADAIKAKKLEIDAMETRLTRGPFRHAGEVREVQRDLKTAREVLEIYQRIEKERKAAGKPDPKGDPVDTRALERARKTAEDLRKSLRDLQYDATEPTEIAKSERALRNQLQGLSERFKEVAAEAKISATEVRAFDEALQQVYVSLRKQSSEKRIDELKRENELLQRRIQAIRQSARAAAELETQIAKEAELLEAERTITADLLPTVRALIEARYRLLQTYEQEQRFRALADQRAEERRYEQERKRLEELERERERALALYTTIIEGMRDAFVQFFTEVFNRGVNTFRQLFNTIKQLFMRMLAEMLAAALIRRLGGIFKNTAGIGDGVSGGGGSTGGSTSGGYGAGMEGLGKIIAKNLLAGGIAGGFVGYGIGSMTTNRAGGALGGALGGAATGFAVAGPLGAVGGAIAGFVGGLLGSSKAAKEAARQMREARRIFEKNLTAFTDAAYGTGSSIKTQLEQIKDAAKALQEANKQAYPITWNELMKGYGRGETRQQRNAAEIERAEKAARERLGEDVKKGLDRKLRDLRGEGYVNEMLDAYEEYKDTVQGIGELYKQGVYTYNEWLDAQKKANQIYVEQIALIKKARAEALKNFEDDLRVRRLVAQGRDSEADALRLQIEHAKELEDAMKEWGKTNPALIEQLKEVQRLEKEKAKLEASGSPFGIPSGYRIELARYNSTAPVPRSSMFAPYDTDTTGGRRDEYTFQFGAESVKVVLPQDTATNPKAQVDAFIKELRDRSLAQFGTSTRASDYLDNG